MSWAKARERTEAILAKIQADESPCCAGAGLTGDDTKDVWVRCAECRRAVYKFSLELGFVLSERFAQEMTT